MFKLTVLILIAAFALTVQEVQICDKMDIIKSFIKAKAINSVSIVECSENVVHLMKHFSTSFVYLSVFPINGFTSFNLINRREALIMNWKCLGQKQVPKDLLSYTNSHLIFTDDLNSTIRWLNPIRDIILSSDITICDENNNLYDMYRINTILRYTKPPIPVLLSNGAWNGTKFENFSATIRKIPERTNLRNIMLDSVVFLNHKLFNKNGIWSDYFIKRLDTTHDSTLFNMKLISFLMDKYNFRIFIKTTNLWTQQQTSNGTKIIGELGFLVEDRAVFSIYPMRMTTSRIDFADFSYIIWTPRFVFLFRHPKFVALKSHYLEPFEKTVWGLIFLSMIISTIVFCFTILIFKKQHPEEDLTITNNFLNVFGIFFQQNSIPSYVMNSSRIIITFTVFFSFIFYQYYTTFIIASLITESPKTIKTLDNLVKSDLQFGCSKDLYSRPLFQDAGPMMMDIYENKIHKYGNEFDLKEGVIRIKQGNFAFHHDAEAMYEIVKAVFSDDEDCDLTEIAFFKPFPCALMFQKESPYLELFNIGFQKLFETGILTKERDRYFARKPKCVKSNVEVVPVDSRRTFSPFIVLICGMLFSLSILFIEILLYKLKKDNNTV